MREGIIRFSRHFRHERVPKETDSIENFDIKLGSAFVSLLNRGIDQEEDERDPKTLESQTPDVRKASENLDAL